jgi:hypothetical protein
VRTWNRGAERLWSLPAGQAVGRNIGGLLIASVIPRIGDAMADVIRHGRRVEVPVASTAPDGRPRPDGVLCVSPLRDGAGVIIGAIGAVTLSAVS